MAAAGPATVAPQQVAVDGEHGQALGGVGMAFGVIPDLLVGPPARSLHPCRQPVDHNPLAGLGQLHQQSAKVRKGSDERPVRLAVPARGEQQVHAVADLGHGDPDHAAGAPVGQPV